MEDVPVPRSAMDTPVGITPMVDESKLSDEAKTVLQIIRAEHAASRITDKQRQVLEEGVVLRDAGILVRKFILWFAGTIAALTTIWIALQKLLDMVAAYLKSRGM